MDKSTGRIKTTGKVLGDRKLRGLGEPQERHQTLGSGGAFPRASHSVSHRGMGKMRWGWSFPMGFLEGLGGPFLRMPRQNAVWAGERTD